MKIKNLRQNELILLGLHSVSAGFETEYKPDVVVSTNTGVLSDISEMSILLLNPWSISC